MQKLIIRKNNIIILIFSIIFIALASIIAFSETNNLGRVILPYSLLIIISGITYIFLKKKFTDKFFSKVFLISILAHLAFMAFWQLMKYYILGLHMPSENTFGYYITDVDGSNYHLLGVHISNHFTATTLSKNFYGGLFPKLIGIIYHYTTVNPTIIVCLNTFVAGLLSLIWFQIAKITLQNRNFAKIFTLLCIFNFSHLMNTSILMRDVYIGFFMYLAIYFSYIFYQKRKFVSLLLTGLSLWGLYQFRPYIAFILLVAIGLTFIVKNIDIKFEKFKIKANLISMVVIFLMPLIVGIGLFFITNIFEILSVEDLIEIRETAYTGSNTDYSFDFLSLYNIFPLLPFVIGYICLFFAPFPWEWVLVRRMIYVVDMIVLYMFLSSFFKNLKYIFVKREYFTILFIFIIILMFTIYSITVGNSGSIHRLRGIFIPMIYIIALVRPDKFLTKIFERIRQWEII